MSAKVQLGATLTVTVLVLIIGVIVISGSQANEQAAKQAAKDSAQAKIDSAAAKAIASDVNQTLTDFFAFYNERVQIGNNNTNNTQRYILQGIDEIVSEIRQGFGNLSAHRQVTNATFDKVNESLYRLEHIVNTTSALTGPEYEKLADQRVADITGNLSEEHKLIFEALNITRSDNGEVNETQLGQLLKEFIQAQKVDKNEPKGPKVK